MALISLHLALALALFFFVNWIGKHAVDFGYVSTTLFEEPNESVALNFFLRALAPSVFIIAISAIFVATDHAGLRIGIFWVVIYYYIIRALIIFVLNRQGLISWPRYAGHALVGVAAAMLAYQYLIIPNRSLMPNLDQAGNELWLAILAFLYAVSNKVPLPGGPGARRRNSFVRRHYAEARRRFGTLIDAKIHHDLLKLITYSVLIYEDYCRPPAIRRLERLMWWKGQRTTGIMRVASREALTDIESVDRGADALAAAWAKTAASNDDLWSALRSTIAAYNPDEDYISKVMDVMEILAKRIAPEFRPAYASVYGE